jgi:hypothetical protein
MASNSHWIPAFASMTAWVAKLSDLFGMQLLIVIPAQAGIQTSGLAGIYNQDDWNDDNC